MDYIDASNYTRAESTTRLGYGDRFTRTPNWAQDNTCEHDNFACQCGTL